MTVELILWHFFLIQQTFYKFNLINILTEQQIVGIE